MRPLYLVEQLSPRTARSCQNRLMENNPSLTPPEVLQTSWLALNRVDQPEWLDLGLGSNEEVAQNLAEMWRINRFLGGYNALSTHLLPRLAAHSEPITVLDLGTGSADMPIALAGWARGLNLNLRIMAVDWAYRNIAVGRRRTQEFPEIQVLCADAGHLPLRHGSVDYVISSLFLHHFSPSQAVEILRSAYGWAKRGIIMSDLVRGWLPLAGFKLIQPIFARNTLTRHDGALSIRRAYTPDELSELAAAAGLPHAQVTTHWPWRMTLVAEP
jgi:hypothetical protein